MDYVRLDDAGNIGSFDGEVARGVERRRARAIRMARQRATLHGGDYRRDHPRASAQRPKTARTELRIMG